MRFVRIAALVAAAMLVATSARAELRHVELKTLGMDWEICAHAVSVAMKKVNGVDSVRVSLKEGLTILDLKPGNAVTLAQLRTIIKNNGFVSKEATIVARGHLATVNGRQSVAVEGTGETLTPDDEVRNTSDGLRFVTKN